MPFSVSVNPPRSSAADPHWTLVIFPVVGLTKRIVWQRMAVLERELMRLSVR